MTQRIAECRDKLSLLWHEKAAIWWGRDNMTFQSDDQYFAFCVAKDWIQDTAEALLHHRRSDFSYQPVRAYLEFWGVLQAIFVQQDAIRQLWYAFHGTDKLDPNPAAGSASEELRELRNLAAGHPVKNTSSNIAKVHRSTARCVSARQRKSYNRIPLSVYVAGEIERQSVNLAELIDRYDAQTVGYLDSCYLRRQEQLKA